MFYLLIYLFFFYTAFKEDNSSAWFKRERSMADWDDQQVAEAAAKIVEDKQHEVEAKAAKIKAEEAQKKSSKEASKSA